MHPRPPLLRRSGFSVSLSALDRHFYIVPGVTRLKHRIDQTAVLVEGYRRRIGARIAVEPSSRDPGIALPVVVVVSRPDNCGHAGVGETGSGTRGH